MSLFYLPPDAGAVCVGHGRTSRPHWKHNLQISNKEDYLEVKTRRRSSRMRTAHFSCRLGMAGGDFLCLRVGYVCLEVGLDAWWVSALVEGGCLITRISVCLGTFGLRRAISFASVWPIQVNDS